MSEVVWLPNNTYKPIAPSFVNFKKRCTWLAAANYKVYKLLAHGRWFSPASSTTKTGRHDIAEILLKVATTRNQIKIINVCLGTEMVYYCDLQFLRKVFWYHRGNQTPWIEEGQTTQWPKEKFVDIKGVIRSRESKKDRQHNGQKKSL